MTFARPVGPPPSVPPLVSQPFSINEMTGIQALERIAPILPVRPGRVERRKFEYTRHGTCTLIASFNVATGAASADIGETRTEEDFAARLAALVQQPRMHLAMDNLNTHYSESAVRLVAARHAPHRLTTRFDHKRYHYFCSTVLGFLEGPESLQMSQISQPSNPPRCRHRGRNRSRRRRDSILSRLVVSISPGQVPGRNP